MSKDKYWKVVRYIKDKLILSISVFKAAFLNPISACYESDDVRWKKSVGISLRIVFPVHYFHGLIVHYKQCNCSSIQKLNYIW